MGIIFEFKKSGRHNRGILHTVNLHTLSHSSGSITQLQVAAQLSAARQSAAFTF